jgi:calpain-7
MDAPRQLKHPSSAASLRTTREKIILLQGSKLNGCVFPEWTSDPGVEEFFTPERYQDDTNYYFSEAQEEVFAGWQRPLSTKTPSPPTASIQVDLVQDLTSDCSVVASLCAGSARAERLRRVHPGYSTRLMASVMFPFLAAGDMSNNGKYVFKFNFNGCFRKVVIDDRLPTSKTERMLHVFDRGNRDMFWPALLEKAYLKVRGGYNFPGSNSGTDLWVLSGWIPEQIFLQR